MAKNNNVVTWNQLGAIASAALGVFSIYSAFAYTYSSAYNRGKDEGCQYIYKTTTEGNEHQPANLRRLDLYSCEELKGWTQGIKADLRREGWDRAEEFYGRKK